ncbi:MAG: GLPGLI family protein [Tissierellia bacterium]|nr:GLPGLI family protein [Tissierellia bacterium]
MKKLYLPFVFIFFVQFLCSQENKETIIQIGGLDRYDSIPPQKLEDAHLRVWYEFIHEITRGNKGETIKDTMVLVVGDNYSVYYDWTREIKYKQMISQLDNAKKTTKFITYKSNAGFEEIANNDSQLFEFTLNRDNSEILKDRKKGMIITTDLDDADIGDEKLYLLEEKIPFPKWQLQDETLEVMGYKCQKATCNFRGRNYTAWFTMDIPVNDGPYKFYGLPGLILMIEDSGKLFCFKAVGLEQLNNTEIISENKEDYIKCTPKQYKSIKKRMRETIFQYYSQGETLYVTKTTLPVQYEPIEIE